LKKREIMKFKPPAKHHSHSTTHGILCSQGCCEKPVSKKLMNGREVRVFCLVKRSVGICGGVAHGVLSIPEVHDSVSVHVQEVMSKTL
jgi:hypothetical protein